MRWFLDCKRLFHSSLVCLGQVEKSLLAKIRKRTGYSFVNCKKALTLHDNDIEKVLPIGCLEFIIIISQSTHWFLGYGLVT